MFTLLFILFVVAGFLFMFLSTWPTPSFTARVAWGCWLAASLLWGFTQVGGR